MRKITLILVCTLLIFAGELPFAAAGPEPGSKEILGSHAGTIDKGSAPQNMVLVPAGKVWMGMKEETALDIGDNSPGTALNVSSRSIPKHQVRLEEFFCDITEVTNLQWQTYLNQTSQKPSKLLMELVWKNDGTYKDGEDMLPIRNVTLYEAREFARWCGKKIPTEAEWLRAAAGDDGRIYPWGNDYDRNLCTNKRNRLLPVGSYEGGKSPFDILDMSGSVYEWTETRMVEFPRFKLPKIKMGKKWVNPTPGFNPQLYVVKGGHYLGGAIQHRLDIREGSLPSDSLDSMGFRCVKAAQPGATLLEYARSDLQGSAISEVESDMKNLYAVEMTEFTDSDPKVISKYDFLSICPSGKALTTIEKITKGSQDIPFPIAILTTNQSIEEPNLPPGSYVMAYRHNGLSAAAKKAKIDADAAAEEAELEKKKKEAEEKKKKEEEKPGEADTPKSQEEIEAEKRKQAEIEKIRKENEAIEREEREAREALEKIGAVAMAKAHIDFPTDKNLIVFMNTNDTIVGYVEIEGIKEDKGVSPIRVSHSAANGMTDVELCVQVYGKIPRFPFSFKLKNNPF